MLVSEPILRRIYFTQLLFTFYFLFYYYNTYNTTYILTLTLTYNYILTLQFSFTELLLTEVKTLKVTVDLEGPILSKIIFLLQIQDFYFI